LVVGEPLSPPSLEHLFGTDQLGRDVFSRAICGTRIDLGLSLAASAAAIFLGGVLGLLAGYVRGWVDNIVMRIVDTLISLPPLILALLVVSALRGSALLLVGTVVFVYTPRVSRVARGAALDVMTEDFVAVATARGESAWSIAIRELLPNVLGVLLVEFAVRFGFAVIMIGSLSFLGVGLQPPTPEWGLMISESRNAMAVAPWTVLFPALMMASLVVAVNIIAEAVARALGSTATGETI